MINKLKRKWINLTSDVRLSEVLIGSAWAIVAQVLATGLGLVSSIIIARFYGAEVVGIVAVLNSFLLLATIFTVLGTSTSLLRLIPEYLAKYSPTSAFRLYRKTQYMVIAISLVTGTLFFFSADLIADKVFSKPHLSFYFALGAVFVVFNSLMILNTEAVRGLRLIRVFAFMQILPQGFKLILLIMLGALMATKNVPIYAMLAGIALTGIMGWVIMEYAFKKRMQPLDVIRPVPIREILAISLPMLMTKTMIFVIGQTGVIMIGMYQSEADVGYYAIAVSLATLTSFILSAINSMVAPKFSELFHSGKIDELLYVAKKSAKLIFWTTTPILSGTVLFGKQILNIIYGQEFAVAYPALMILVFGQFVNSISGSCGYFLNMTGNQNVLLNIMLMAALANIGLNLLLIPDHGIYGAAVSTMISICFWNIASLIYIKAKFGKTTGYFPLLAQ